MHIQPNQGNSTPSAAHDDLPTAPAHAALFPAQLALARWMHGGDVPHVFACSRSIGRAAWFAETQMHFQAWLDAGGFHQPELDSRGNPVQEDSSCAHATRSGTHPAANPAWYDVTRCRVVQDSGCTE